MGDTETIARTKPSGSKNALSLRVFASYPLEALEDMIKIM